MKIALIIIVAIISLILLLLFLPLTVDLTYKKEFMLKIKYLGITIFSNKKRTKTKKNNKKASASSDKKSAKKEDGFVKKTYKQKGLLGTISYFSEIFTIVFKKLWRVIKRFEIRRFKLNLTVSTSDAANTAIKYGEVCAAMYPALSLLQANTDFKPKNINISADFDKTKSEFSISFLIKTKLFYWLIAVFGVLKQFLKLQRKEREKYERKQS